MNYQTTFTKVIKALRKQGCRSFNKKRDTCAYQSGSNKCAIGHLLTEKQMASAKKFYGPVQDLLYYFRMKNIYRNNLPDDALAFLSALQVLHDNPQNLVDVNWNGDYKSEEEWRKWFELAVPVFAKTWKLNVPESKSTRRSERTSKSSTRTTKKVSSRPIR